MIRHTPLHQSCVHECLNNCKYSHSHHCCSMYNTLNNPSAHPSYSHYYLLSPSTLFFFLYNLLFFAHLVVFCTSFLHILLSFAHLIVFCTSYCLLHILLFLHISLFFFISLHILLLFLIFLPYVCPCVMLLYIICILIILHCPLSGPDSITFHF